MVAVNESKRFYTSEGSYYMCTVGQDIKAQSVMTQLVDIKMQPFAQTVPKQGFGTGKCTCAEWTMGVPWNISGIFVSLCGRSIESRTSFPP